MNDIKSCLKCEYLTELYERTPKSERDYWIMTELFVMLHDGDICNEKIKEKPCRK
jgi:hypothetical protein